MLCLSLLAPVITRRLRGCLGRSVGRPLVGGENGGMAAVVMAPHGSLLRRLPSFLPLLLSSARFRLVSFVTLLSDRKTLTVRPV